MSSDGTKVASEPGAFAAPEQANEDYAAKHQDPSLQRYVTNHPGKAAGVAAGIGTAGLLAGVLLNKLRNKKSKVAAELQMDKIKELDQKATPLAPVAIEGIKRLAAPIPALVDAYRLLKKTSSAREILAGVLLLNKTADVPPELLAGGIGALGGGALGAINAQPDSEGKVNRWKSALLSALLSGGLSAGLTHMMNRR